MVLLSLPMTRLPDQASWLRRITHPYGDRVSKGSRPSGHWYAHGTRVPTAIDNARLDVLSGIIGIAFGAYLVVSPGDGALAALFVIGFYAPFASVMYLAIGMRLRSFAKATQAEPTGAQTAS
jgi:hypothetical protein